MNTVTRVTNATGLAAYEKSVPAGDRSTGRVIVPNVRKEEAPRGRPKLGTSSGPKLRRLQLKLSERGFERLEKLRTVSDAVSAADVVRDALRVYEALIEEVQKGNAIFVGPDDDTAPRVRIQLW